MEHAPRRRLPPRFVDAAVVLLVAVVALLGLAVWWWAGDPDVPLWASVLLGVGQAAALWWRRTRPLVVLAATLVLLVAAQAIGDLNAASFWGPHVAVYSAAAYSRDRRAWVALVVLVVAALLDGAAVAWIDDSPAGPVLISPSGLAAVIAWGSGRYVRMRRDYVETLVAYAQQLERQQEQRAQQVILDERRRIARELHDQVAHHLGVVSLQTAAARRWLDRDRDRAAQAVESAEQAARNALSTMPRILRALRATDAARDLHPQPTVDELPQLVDDVSGTGLPTTLEIEGERRPLRDDVELTTYRIVQEALTNAMKHAGPARAVVRLRYRLDRLDVEVTDDGHGPAASPGAGARQGLVGLRERVELVGGELHAGPNPGGGFRIQATLPTRTEVPS
ncbi:MAG TPA: sensor histidine kinase [Nitriliruptorales bacterium]|nr:sensor histidine kinase [Nitriliruptorales bacterium]